LGLSASDHAAILAEVAYAGLDIIKDDEILGDLDIAPTLERLKACRQVIEAVKQKTGRTIAIAIYSLLIPIVKFRLSPLSLAGNTDDTGINRPKK
jgi:hypothetical protein